MKNLEPLDIFS